MTPAEHLRILGPAFLAEMRRRGATAPPPPPEVIEELRPIFAPAMARAEAQLSAPTHQAAA